MDFSGRQAILWIDFLSDVADVAIGIISPRRGC